MNNIAKTVTKYLMLQVRLQASLLTRLHGCPQVSEVWQLVVQCGPVVVSSQVAELLPQSPMPLHVSLQPQ